MCAYFGIPDEEVVVAGEIPLQIWSELQQSAGPSITIVRNQSDPQLIEDGVVGITVEPLSDDVFKVSYRGFVSGQMAVTADGMEQLGKHLFEDRKPVPDWLLTDVESISDLPAFMPAEIELNPPVDCRECGATERAADVLTPGGGDPICEVCWQATH